MRAINIAWCNRMIKKHVAYTVRHDYPLMKITLTHLHENYTMD